MNITRLRELRAALGELLQRFDHILGAAEQEHDPLAVHIYLSRRRYQEAATRDQSKHQRTVEDEIDRSYREACALCFLGTRHDWLVILYSTPDRAKAMSSTGWRPRR